MKLTMKQAKTNFFDRKAVQDSIGKKKAAMLMRQGGLVRKIAQRSMKRKKGPSKPGTPPNAHKGYLRDYMIFALDPKDNSVVIGPARLGTSTVPTTVGRGGVVEEWGIFDRRGRWVPLRTMNRTGRQKAMLSGRVVKRKAKVEARPFMELAVKAARPGLDKIAQQYFKKKP